MTTNKDLYGEKLLEAISDAIEYGTPDTLSDTLNNAPADFSADNYPFVLTARSSKHSSELTRILLRYYSENNTYVIQAANSAIISINKEDLKLHITKIKGLELNRLLKKIISQAAFDEKINENSAVWISMFNDVVDAGGDDACDDHMLYTEALTYGSHPFIEYFANKFPKIISEKKFAFTRFCSQAEFNKESAMILLNNGAELNWLSESDWLSILSSYHQSLKNPAVENLLSLPASMLDGKINPNSIDTFMTSVSKIIFGYFEEIRSYHMTRDVGSAQPELPAFSTLNTAIKLIRYNLANPQAVLNTLKQCCPFNIKDYDDAELLFSLFKLKNNTISTFACSLAVRLDELPKFASLCDESSDTANFMMAVVKEMRVDLSALLLNMPQNRALLIQHIMN